MIENIIQSAIGAAFVALGWIVKSVITGKKRLEKTEHASLIAKAGEMDRTLEESIRKEISDSLDKMDKMFSDLQTVIDLHREEAAREAAKVGKLEVYQEALSERMASFENRLAQEFSATRESFDKLRSDVIAALTRS